MKGSLAIVGSWAFAVSTVVAFSAETYREAVMADRPFAYYRLNEASNNDAVTDELGHNPGVFINEPEVGIPGAILSDPEDKAVHLARAQNQYIKLTNLGKYGSGISNGFTVECWLKTANSKDHQNVFGTANKPDYITDFLVDIAYENSPGRLRIYCRDDHSDRFGADCYPGGKNINIYDNRWHHIVYVCEPETQVLGNQVKLYIDGERQTISTMHKGGTLKISAFDEPVTLGAMDLRGDIADSLDGSLDEVAFYETRLSADQIARHYRAAGYQEHEHRRAALPHLEYPSPTPVANADPSARHDLTVQVPTKFTVQRKPDQMIVAADLTDSKTEKTTVGENMVTGMEYRFFAYPEGTPAPAEADSFGLSSGLDFGNAHCFFNRTMGGIPKEGTAYTVEMRWKIFETDIPPQHFWSPEGKKYKVVLEGTVQQTVE